MVSLIQAIGLLGVLILNIAGYPQAMKTIKEKSTDDISFVFLLFWLTGMILNSFYIALSVRDPVLIFGCLLGFPPGIVILCYKIQSMRKHQNESLNIINDQE